jgi:hypothetical protein
MMSTLHIHNGDSTASTMRFAEFPGRHFPFREVLMEGPTPAGLNADAWRTRRAEFLTEEYEIEEDVAAGLLEGETVLASFPDHEEVVLWFEHDLFCQINLIYLLDWFARQELGSTRLSMVCIDGFPGKENFRGLGELSADELVSLYPSRKTVTPEQKREATRAWAAYRAPSPRVLEKLLSEDTSALPFLSGALSLHLARLPSLENGLNRIENRALRIISAGSSEFGQLFAEFWSSEAAYGLGDAQLWSSLKRLSTCSPALLTLNTVNGSSKPAFSHSTAALTETGRTILSGSADFVATCGIDRWVGGAHLTSEKIWRWDAAANLLRD